MPGRPRDPHLEQRLLAAAWALLRSEGYDALTLTRVAAQAKAHRTDVYRRWSSKAQLVTDVLDEYLPPVSDVDTGALRSDFLAYVEDLAAAWSAPWIDGLVGLLADVRRDPDAEAAFRRLAERRGQPWRKAVARAAARGEIGEIPDGFLAGDLLEGPLMHRRLILGHPFTPEYLAAIADSAHRYLSATPVSV